MKNWRCLLTTFVMLMTATPLASADGPTTQRSRSSVIVPAGAWSDQNGDLVQLHGIGLLQVGDTYYAYGQDNRNGEPYYAVACYSSKDLATWKRHEDALAFDQAEQLKAEMFDDPRFVVERPKVLHNRRTGQFVMLFHFDNAVRNKRYVGVGVCDRPDGRFQYVRKFKPQGNWSADMGVFVDPNDGQAYLIGEDRVNGKTTAKSRTVFYKLNDDYTDVQPDWNLVLPPITHAGPKFPSVESPTMVYDARDKLYYVFGSLLTGWAANDNVYATTPSLTEPKWSPYRLIAKAKTNTHTSQVSFVLPVQGTEATSYVYIGDRWLTKHLWDSPPVFLPLAIGGGKATLNWHDAWSIDLKKGTWRPEKPAQMVEAETATFAGGASVVDDADSSGGKRVALPHAGSTATFGSIRVDTAGPHTLELNYRNPDAIARFGFDSNRRAMIRVNGGPGVRLSFPTTTDRVNPVTKATLPIRLLAGEPNTIEIIAENGAGPDLDTIAVYAP